MTMNVRELASRVEAGSHAPPASHVRPGARQGGQFEAVLAEAQRKTPAASDGFRVSVHALQRIEQRAIPFEATDQVAMEKAFDTLASKGARDALVVREGSAFVVNVPSRTIVTALSEAERQNRVFTQLDSTLFM